MSCKENDDIIFFILSNTSFGMENRLMEDVM